MLPKTIYPIAEKEFMYWQKLRKSLDHSTCPVTGHVETRISWQWHEIKIKRHPISKSKKTAYFQA